MSLDWQIIIERLNVYMTSVTNVATYVPCKMKQESTKNVHNFFLGEFLSADNKNYAYSCVLRSTTHIMATVNRRRK